MISSVTMATRTATLADTIVHFKRALSCLNIRTWFKPVQCLVHLSMCDHKCRPLLLIIFILPRRTDLPPPIFYSNGDSLTSAAISGWIPLIILPSIYNAVMKLNYSVAYTTGNSLILFFIMLPSFWYSICFPWTHRTKAVAGLLCLEIHLLHYCSWHVYIPKLNCVYTYIYKLLSRLCVNIK